MIEIKNDAESTFYHLNTVKGGKCHAENNIIFSTCQPSIGMSRIYKIRQNESIPPCCWCGYHSNGNKPCFHRFWIMQYNVAARRST